MITISVKDTKNPDALGLLGTDAFKSTEDAVLSIANLAENGLKPDLLGEALKNIDENFMVVVEDSSVVEVIDYNFKTEVLNVHLTSGTYEYKDIPAIVFLRFIQADSKGQFYNRYIKNA